MKKIFTFSAALTIAASTFTITSCSNNEIEQWSNAQFAQAKYEKAFIARFGQPAANQTWGFGTVTKALTRSANPNSNQWFDENQMNLEKPADITDAERIYVMNWFATNTKANETIFDFNDYFVQQVDYSNKEYKANNKDGSEVSITSKGHMDQIFANLSDGSSDHVNNFNADSGWIMLMQNSETKYGFGYVESYGTDDKDVKNNYLMAEIDVPGVGKGYYVGLDYQAKKSGEGIDLKPDGKYDDRVLKIVPAKQKTPEADVRVIAEDLSVDDNSDFDFNDVVFDVTFNYPVGKTTITLLAAGGTLPLYVGGHEIHGEFGVSTSTMVNTGAGASKDPVSFVLEGTFNNNANNITVSVDKDGERMPITAQRGEVASKIAVKPNYEWCKERQDIEAKYPVFGQYVKGKVEGGNWWEEK